MHYAIGHPPRGSNASPVLIYAGASGSAARAAMQADTASAEHELISHVVGVRKRNANFSSRAEQVKADTVEEEVKTETKRGRK